MREYITLIESSLRDDSIDIIDLPYSESALSPVLSSGHMRFHYGQLAKGYAERFNKGEGDKRFNYAGAVLHNLLFAQFRAPRRDNQPNGPVGNLINSRYKDWDNFRDKFYDAATKLHGSGWVYLARNGDIKTFPNHDLRSDIVILVDLWEHAYNGDYGSNKKKYLENIWRIMNWSVINTRFMAPYKI